MTLDRYCLLSIFLVSLAIFIVDSSFNPGECRLFKRKPVELGRDLTDKESKLFNAFWIEARKYRYFDETLDLKDTKKKENKKKASSDANKKMDVSKKEYEEAILRRKKELKNYFRQYLAYKTIYDTKRNKNTVLKKWALVRIELRFALPSMCEVLEEIDREIGIDSKIFKKVAFIENLGTRKLTPFIKPLRRSWFGYK